jgi:hypothetical protein
MKLDVQEGGMRQCFVGMRGKEGASVFAEKIFGNT